ncbi:MAG: tRNA (N(6)-L-threonylcarbamoyladenosine(37)-C(2))-methylthiotransferase MtaB [Bryobacteraceae bacterium]|nr:tRNA (N(6)-L-threonylcarbamoyladenosine(37)-C(2))-methylthiotransferase MtaB [Bryobacteraceae bacterium]
MRFHVTNFGCRSSQADGAAIKSLLSRNGMEEVADHKSAEFVILNTCTVTATADDELRQIVRRVNRENPEAQIVITGCYAQRAPQELIDLPGVSMVVGNSHKTKIAELLVAPYHGEVHVGDIFEAGEFLATPVEGAAGGRSRPNLKIQDGCPNRCSFCIIPYVRGNSRSARVEHVVAQVRDLSAAGYPEVVLTGINLGRWGREAGLRMRLADLIRILLNETDVQRLRLSSVEPMDWSDDLLHLMADSPRIAKHMHAPLQSGSDTVLRRMHRKYRPHHYVSRVRLARELMPDAGIGADVMTGFPGETDAEFEQTRALVEELPFTYLHIFPYSERPGTPAAEALDHVPWAKRKERGRVLKQLAVAKNEAFRRRMVGRTLSVVTLGNGEAMASNYITVELTSPRPGRNIYEIVAGSTTASGLREYCILPVLC